jgi:hypothetical protein
LRCGAGRGWRLSRWERYLRAESAGESGRSRGKRQRVGVSDEEVGMRGKHAVRKQLTALRVWPAVDNAMKHSMQVGARVDVVRDARRDDREDNGGAFGALVEPGEEPILSAMRRSA